MERYEGDRRITGRFVPFRQGTPGRVERGLERKYGISSSGKDGELSEDAQQPEITTSRMPSRGSVVSRSVVSRLLSGDTNKGFLIVDGDLTELLPENNKDGE